MTTQNRNRALINSRLTHNFTKDKVSYNDFDGELLLFEIYLNNKNAISTNIELSTGDFTYYQSEEEVLLMPMFTFQVTKVTTSQDKVTIYMDRNNKNPIKAIVTTITLVQIPFLELIKIRPIFETSLVWHNINSALNNQDVNNMANWLQKVSELSAVLEYCRTPEEVFGCVDQSIRTTLIIDGEEGLNFIKQLFSGISFNYSICGIIIFDKKYSDDGESKKLLEMIKEWRSNISLPILKKFSIEIASNMQELQDHTSLMINESHGIKKDYGDKRMKAFVDKIEKRN